MLKNRFSDFVYFSIFQIPCSFALKEIGKEISTQQEVSFLGILFLHLANTIIHTLMGVRVVKCLRFLC